jgi:hypothetical protein
MLQLGLAGLGRMLRENQIRHQRASLDKILAWATQAARLEPHPDAELRHSAWTDLEAVWRQLRRRIDALEVEIAGDLAQTPYVRLLAIPGVNVVSAGEFGGEMGPIANYANANAITGRSGLFPSRHQSDAIDRPNGRLVRQANRRLRAAIMRIADNLCRLNAHFGGRAALARAAKVDERAIRVKIAKSFTRVAYAAVAGDQALRHPCAASRDSIIKKLLAFHGDHPSTPAAALADLENCVSQLLPESRGHEKQIVELILEEKDKRRRGPVKLGALLPAVLARLDGADARALQPPTQNSPPGNQG